MKHKQVSYEDWYNAQLSMKERIDGIRTELPILIEGNVKKYVNGRIDKANNSIDEIKVLLDTLIRDNKEWREEEDKYKEENKPYMEGLKNLTKGGKIFVFIMGGLATVSAGMIAIKQLFK